MKRTRKEKIMETIVVGAIWLAIIAIAACAEGLADLLIK